MTKRFIFLLTCIILTMSAISCTNESNINPELQVVGLVTSIGSLGDVDGIDKQVLSYEVTIHNHRDEDVYINSIEPIFRYDFLKKVITKETKIDVRKTVLSNTSIGVTGQIIFNSKGLTKSDIEKIEPYITDFKIYLEKIVPINKNRK